MIGINASKCSSRNGVWGGFFFYCLRRHLVIPGSGRSLLMACGSRRLEAPNKRPPNVEKNGRAVCVGGVLQDADKKLFRVTTHRFGVTAEAKRGPAGVVSTADVRAWSWSVGL